MNDREHEEIRGYIRDNDRRIEKLEEEHFEGSCHPTRVEYMDLIKGMNELKKQLQKMRNK